MPPRKKVLPNVTDIDTPTKIKRNKKNIKVVAIVTPNGIEGNFNPEPRKPLIAHLEVHSNEVVFLSDQNLRYDPTPPVQPEPYDPLADDNFIMTEGVIEDTKDLIENINTEEETLKYDETVEQNIVSEDRPLQVFSKCDLMIEFANTNKVQKIPETTNIACYWCSHTFSGMPYIIPESERNGVYKVYGNFCCDSCAMSYLLKESLDPHIRWDRMALLYRIYDHDGKGRIYPAPPKECLELYGGPLTIDSYRATILNKKVRVDLHMPPMVSIIGSIDTKPIDFYDTSVKSNITLLPYDKIQKTEEGLRLKRTKPLKDKESTLDSCMNITIKNKN
jgi:hypothetical protein